MSAISRRALPVFFGALALVPLFGVQSSRALEDFKVYRGVLVLEGRIVKGDYDKLRNFLGNKTNFEKISGGMFLASPGGSIIEAMKIGRLIRALRLSTSAPSGPALGGRRFGESVITPGVLADAKSNYGCASACFFIYIAGVERHVGWAGRLGIHRPFELESETRKLDVDQQTNRNWQVRGLVQRYLKEMDVPEKYVDLMYSVPSNEVRWFTQSEVDADFQGSIPELKDWVGARCNSKMTGAKAASAGGDGASELAGCRMRAKSQLSNEAWTKVFPGR